MNMLGLLNAPDIFTLFARISIVIKLKTKSVRLHIVTFPDMPHNWGIVFCDEINPDLQQKQLCLKCGANNVNIASNIFAPEKYDINTGAMACSYLNKLARACRELGISCVFINGHFNQHGASSTGRGHILCTGENIYTMDIFHAIEDSFLKDLVGVTVK